MGSIEVSVRPQVAEPKLKFSADANTEAYARNLDAEDPLRSFRDKFIIPSKANLKSKGLSKPGETSRDVDHFSLFNLPVRFC
jgi:kynureninase